MSIYDELFGSASMRTLFAVPASLQRMLAVEAALARAQARLGLVPAAAAEAIAAAASVDHFDVSAIAASTRTVGYPIVALTKALAAAAGPEAGRYVHLGATTQDILDTALVLQMRSAFALIEDDLVATIRALAAKAVAHRNDVMAGRTHLQHAVPVTFGYTCSIWLSPLLDHLEALRRDRERILLVQFGGAAGTLASLGDNGRKVTMELGLELDLAVPEVPWHATRGPVSIAAAWLAMLSASLAKFATDVILLSQTEVGEVYEPHAAGRGGSSTMPQKRNPIGSEYIIASARGALAVLPALIGSAIGDHERSSGPWQSEFITLPQAFVLTSGALMHAREIAHGMQVDSVRMRRNIESSGGLLLAEAISAALAPHFGRAQAHETVEHACATALAEGHGLADVLARDASISAVYPRAALEELLDPARYLGDAPALVDRVVARARRVCGE